MWVWVDIETTYPTDLGMGGNDLISAAGDMVIVGWCCVVSFNPLYHMLPGAIQDRGARGRNGMGIGIGGLTSSASIASPIT